MTVADPEVAVTVQSAGTVAVQLLAEHDPSPEIDSVAAIRLRELPSRSNPETA